MCSWRTTGQREPLEVPKLKVVFAELGLAEQGLCVQDQGRGTETTQAVCGKNLAQGPWVVGKIH